MTTAPTASTTTPASAKSRSGVRHWMRSYGLMVSWEMRSMRVVMPLALVVQVLIGGGLVVGFGFLVGDMPVEAATYLVTGLTVVSMVTIGFVLAPQIIAAQKQAGTYDYMWSLPVPRTTSVAANLTVNSLIALPGMIISLLIGVWRYSIDLDVQWLVIPAVLLTLVTAASVGMAMAHAVPNPMITALITQILVFFILLFSPINFPPDRLPPWLAFVHQGLPFQHSATVMRGTLTGEGAGLAEAFLVLGIWAVLAWSVTAWVVGRRG